MSTSPKICTLTETYNQNHSSHLQHTSTIHTYPIPGFSSMRRGLTSLVTSIDSALTRDDTRSDAASTASSDSDRYVVVGLAAESPDDADMAFRYKRL